MIKFHLSEERTGPEHDFRNKYSSYICYSLAPIGNDFIIGLLDVSDRQLHHVRRVCQFCMIFLNKRNTTPDNPDNIRESDVKLTP